MNESQGLDGTANEGFNADISLVRPSSFDSRRTRGVSVSRLPSRIPSTRVVEEEQEDGSSSNNEADLLQKATQPVTGLRMRIMRFTPSWFSVTMGTGICNSLLFLMPWQATHNVFKGIGCAFLVLDIFLFIFFISLTIARYTMFPSIWMAMLGHPVHSLFLGTLPMGFVTIISGIALQGSEFGLSGSIEAAAGLWWVALVLACLTSFCVPLAMQTISTHTSDSLTAAWLLPIVPPITIAAAGSSIANLLIDSNPEYALKIWIASYIMNGIGCLLASMVLVLYFQRLILHHIPGREVVVSTFLPLGPCGQGGYALLQLGRVSRRLFPVISALHADDTDGLGIIAEAANGLYAFGIGMGLLTWALGLWFTFIAIASLCVHRYNGSIRFNAGFWSFTFPLGSLNLLTYALAETFSSTFFKVVGTIMTVSVISLWAFVFVPTAKGFYTGSLFQAPCLVKLPDLLADNNVKARGEKGRQAELGNGSANANRGKEGATQQ